MRARGAPMPDDLGARNHRVAAILLTIMAVLALAALLLGIRW